MNDDLSGRTLGRYQVLERLGRGGMAEVYRAYQPSLDRYVAIKVIYPHLATDAGLRERFGREARAVAALHHPNIVQVHDFDMQGDVAFMAMEFIGGPTLKAAIGGLGARGRLLPLPVVGQIVGQVADALAYAHEQRVVHRDVKPANILLRRRAQRRDGAEGAAAPTPMAQAELDDLLLGLGPSSVVLTDFGVARVVSDSVEQTAAGTILGSPAYMSPEQGRGERAGPASDIYSLGVVLYELVTGRVPFDADTPFAIVVKHIQTPLPPPRAFRPDLPEALERVMLKALAKDPGDRFGDAAAFGAAVREACGAAQGATLRLAEAPLAGAGGPEGATRVIEELHATRAGTPAPPTLPMPAPPAPAAPQPRKGRGIGGRLVGCLLVLLVGAALVIGAFVAGGAVVFRGLGEAGALVVPTQLQPELTAAALQGTTIPFLDTRAPATALPDEVAAAIAEAREACGGPGCPGGSASAAVAILDEAIAAEPASAPLLVARARTYLWWDPYTYGEQIAADVEAALQRDPASAEAFLAGGDLAAIRDDPQAALEAYGRAVELAPGSPDAYLARAELLAGAPDYYDSGSPSRAQVIADTTSALAVDPASVRALVLRGNAHYNGGETERAYADFSAALELEPENLEALRRRADTSRYYRDDPAGAIADLTTAAEAYPDDADVRRERLLLLAGAGEYEAALEDAEALVELEPASPESYTLRGYIALALDMPGDAAADFEQALAIAGPGDPLARYGLAKARLDQGDAAAAVDGLAAAAAAPDELSMVWDTFHEGRRRVFIDLAEAYGATGRAAEQLAALDLAIESEEDWHIPHLLRGRLRAAAGDAEGARQDLRRALELAGDEGLRGEITEELRRLP